MNVYFDMGVPRPGTHGIIGKAITHVTRLKRNGRALLWSPGTSGC